MKTKEHNKKGIIGWCLYDWASSAYSSVIMTFIFATYFSEKVAAGKIIGTADWGRALSLSGLLIALISPVVGSIADHEGRRKPWIFVLTYIAIISIALLWFTQPSQSDVLWALTFMVIANTAVEVAMVFYNAMLSDVVSHEYVGRLSGWAWGAGYLGGLSCLVLALFVFVKGKFLGTDLSVYPYGNIRVTTLLVAFWFFIFSIPMFIWTRDRPSTGIGLYRALCNGLKALIGTIRHLKQYREIAKFLLAHMIYMDGLNTIFSFGGIYAAGIFHLTFTEVIEFGIAMNVAAGIGASTFAWLDDYIGAKPTILITLVVLMSSVIGLVIVHSKALFWVLGMLLSICVGPIQAASRSLMVRIAPKELVTEMFGLYALSGKATAFLGPLILSTITLYTQSQRWGIASVLLFLFIGTIILFSVHVKEHINHRKV